MPDQTSGPSKSLSFLVRQAAGEYFRQKCRKPYSKLNAFSMVVSP